MKPYGQTPKRKCWLNNYGCPCCNPRAPSKKRARQALRRVTEQQLADEAQEEYEPEDPAIATPIEGEPKRGSK